MKNIMLIVLILLCVDAEYIYSAQVDDGYPKKVLEIYELETSVVNSLPYAEEFHKVYGDEVKRLISAEYGSGVFDAFAAAGAALQGKSETIGILPSERARIKREQIYERWYRLVEVRVHLESPNESEKSVSSSGSGFVISSNGFIATNYHVVKDAESITVKGLNQYFDSKLKVRVVVEDAANDLAILKITDEAFVSCEMPYSFRYQSAKVGESVFALGYPLTASMGDEIKLSNGIVSSKSGYQNDITSYQISLAAHPGNSGGALFDGNGNVIGVITSKHTEAENTTYAVKIRYLLNLVDFIDADFEIPFDDRLAGLPLPDQVETIKGAIVFIGVTR